MLTRRRWADSVSATKTTFSSPPSWNIRTSLPSRIDCLREMRTSPGALESGNRHQNTIRDLFSKFRGMAHRGLYALRRTCSPQFGGSGGRCHAGHVDCRGVGVVCVIRTRAGDDAFCSGRREAAGVSRGAACALAVGIVRAASTADPTCACPGARTPPGAAPAGLRSAPEAMPSVRDAAGPPALAVEWPAHRSLASFEPPRLPIPPVTALERELPRCCAGRIAIGAGSDALRSGRRGTAGLSRWSGLRAGRWHRSSRLDCRSRPCLPWSGNSPRCCAGRIAIGTGSDAFRSGRRGTAGLSRWSGLRAGRWHRSSRLDCRSRPCLPWSGNSLRCCAGRIAIGGRSTLFRRWHRGSRRALISPFTDRWQGRTTAPGMTLRRHGIFPPASAAFRVPLAET